MVKFLSGGEERGFIGVEVFYIWGVRSSSAEILSPTEGVRKKLEVWYKIKICSSTFKSMKKIAKTSEVSFDSPCCRQFYLNNLYSLSDFTLTGFLHFVSTCLKRRLIDVKFCFNKTRNLHDFTVLGQKIKTCLTIVYNCRPKWIKILNLWKNTLPCFPWVIIWAYVILVWREWR